MQSLLFLAHRIPYPPTKGDKIRSWHILRHLARYYGVHLGAFVDDPDDLQYSEHLAKVCASVKLLPLRPLRAKLRSLSALLDKRALSEPYFYSEHMQDWVDTTLEQEQVRRVFVYSSPMAQYVMQGGCSSLRRVVDFVDVDSDKWRQYAQSKSWPLDWLYRREGRRLLAFEQQVADAFDASVFVSAAEAELFRQLAPRSSARVGYMDNGVDYDYFSPETVMRDPYAGNTQVLVFTGAMDYWANIDAVSWFATEVFPIIRHSVPSAEFFIVGARPAREVLQLARLPGISVTGTVDDVRPYLAHACAAVAPLRIARGVQNKVLEAMSMARPVIATPAAVEGIEHQRLPGLMISDSAAGQAEMATSLLLQPGLSQPINDSRNWVRQRYNWDVNLEGIHELLDGDTGNVVPFVARGTR